MRSDEGTLERSIEVTFEACTQLLGIADPANRKEKAPDILFPIREGKQFGAIDVNGNVIVAPSYEDVFAAYSTRFSPYSKSVGQKGILLLSPEKWLYIGREQRLALEPVIENPSLAINLGDSLFAVYSTSAGKLDDMGLIPEANFDPTGMWRATEGVVARDRISEGRVVISRGGRFGYANRTGNKGAKRGIKGPGAYTGQFGRTW